MDKNAKIPRLSSIILPIEIENYHSRSELFVLVYPTYRGSNKNRRIEDAMRGEPRRRIFDGETTFESTRHGELSSLCVAGILLQRIDISRFSVADQTAASHEFNALHVGYFAVPPCTTVKVHTGAWPWPSVRARTHTTPPRFADSMHARIGAACRAGIRATTARGKAIFLERASKRIRRSAV